MNILPKNILDDYTTDTSFSIPDCYDDLKREELVNLLDSLKHQAQSLSTSPRKVVLDHAIRLAGNIIAEDVVGSLQYAVAHLHTPLIVIMGHEGCGAVAATVEEMLYKTKERKHIESLIKSIKPGLKTLDLKLERDSLMRSAVEANVRWSMRELLALPEAKLAVKEKRVTLVGAVYELNTGRVRFLN